MTFAIIADVLVDGRGRIYVLDEQMMNLRVFDAHGRLLQRVGREGHGPGEFYHPLALAGDGRRLFVADHGNLRLAVFTMADSLVRVGEYRLDFPPTDLCLLGERLYVRGFFRDSLIHEYAVEPSGPRLMRSFGSSQDPHPFRRAMAGRGRLACLPGPNLIVGAVRDSGVVAAYTPEGRLRWTVALRDYAPMAISARGTGITYAYPERGWYHLTIGLVVEPTGERGTVGVQLGVAGRGDGRGEYRSTEWRIVTSDGREGATVATQAPVGFVGGRTTYEVYAEPFPHVLVRGPSP